MGEGPGGRRFGERKKSMIETGIAARPPCSDLSRRRVLSRKYRKIHR